MSTDLLVVVHPWAADPQNRLRRSQCTIAYLIFINLHVLGQSDGIVVIVPPDGHVVSTLLPTSTTEDNARFDVTVFPADEEFRANLLWVVAVPLGCFAATGRELAAVSRGALPCEARCTAVWG